MVYIGAIKLFTGDFVPDGWYFCDGRLLPINGNSQLFYLLGTIYGGDGRTTFALPDLRGKAPIGWTPDSPESLTEFLGENLGETTNTIGVKQMPPHTHTVLNNPSPDQHVLLSTDDAVNVVPQEGDVLAVANFGSGLSATKVKTYATVGTGSDAVNGQKLNTNPPLTIENTGSSQSHNNLQPYLKMNFIMNYDGVFPTRY